MYCFEILKYDANLCDNCTEHGKKKKTNNNNKKAPKGKKKKFIVKTEADNIIKVIIDRQLGETCDAIDRNQYSRLVILTD